MKNIEGSVLRLLRLDIFKVHTQRSAYILDREKVVEGGEMGDDEFMRERGWRDSSYHIALDGR